MKEVLSVPDQIDLVVTRAEDGIIEDLRSWDRSAQHRAEGCGCPQCIGEFKRADMALAKELTRQFYDSDGDEEENWINGTPLITVYQNKFSPMENGIDSGSDSPIGSI